MVTGMKGMTSKQFLVRAFGFFLVAILVHMLLIRHKLLTLTTWETHRLGPSKGQLAYGAATYHNLTFDTNTTDPLPVQWEPPMNASSLCFEWAQNTDDWWTHHPTFQIQSENDTHFCFVHRKANQARFFQTLYEIQFHSDCSKVFTKKMWSDGWGADLRNLLDGLVHARMAKRPFQVDQTPWHYAAKQDVSRPVCPAMGIGCYFLPISSCPQNPSIVSQRADYFHGVPAYFTSRYYYEYLTRPQQWLRKRIYDYSKTLPLTLPCITMHVRRGDSVLGGPGTSHRTYHSIHEYVAPIRNDPKNILLLTDDEDAIAEAQRLYPSYHWMYFRRPRYHGSEGGWEQHLPSDDPAFEVVALLSEFRLAKQCGMLVHSASNFGQLLHAEMKNVDSRIRRINLG
ncbi:hypothetical protein MPSEU_000255900 [Mayamaea pseudoterrestris]|nr:hypothetical protein MPSEU_000255900 [Mayamaea pseudoterrestris]